MDEVEQLDGKGSGVELKLVFEVKRHRPAGSLPARIRSKLSAIPCRKPKTSTPMKRGHEKDLNPRDSLVSFPPVAKCGCNSVGRVQPCQG
jgi:hypothetical protein